jgi:two-component system, OmpR family, alkaline phosphatase synthesis response regulator PhoP
VSKPLLLLVDDALEMALIVVKLGRRAGWEAAVAVDAGSAWEALAQRRPDLVLLDVNLPGVSGLDWLRRVRATPQFTDLPVALYTHWGLPADVAAGLDAGVDFVFDKELATRPADWQRRLEEIGKVRRDGKVVGAWSNDGARRTMEGEARPVPPPQAWAAAFNQALRHPSLRRLSREVLPAVLRRALTQAFGASIGGGDFDAWVAPDGLDPERLPPSFAPGSPVDLAVCLAEQIRRLLGDEAGAAFENALAAAPGIQGFLSRS